MDLQDIFISNLKAARKENKITQEKLAELCGTDTAYIGQIETRKRFPSILFIEKIAKALNIEAWILFKNKNETKKNQKEKIEKLKAEFLTMIDGDIDHLITKLIEESASA